MRWLQFIWREVVTDQDKRVPGTVRHQTAEYPLTTSTEPSQIGWNTDTAWYGRGPQSAFYEIENTVNRTPESLQMFDEPAPPYDEFVRAAFAVQPAPKAVTGRAHLVEYLIKDTEVLFRAELVVEYKYKQPTDKPDAEPKLVSAQLASAIDPGARARLHQQFKELDYIP
jgi:hypothetical protein